MIESDNKLFGLLGKDISYSFSRDYFSNKFRVENIQHKYVNFDLENLSTFKSLLMLRFKCDVDAIGSDSLLLELEYIQVAMVSMSI